MSRPSEEVHLRSQDRWPMPKLRSLRISFLHVSQYASVLTRFTANAVDRTKKLSRPAGLCLRHEDLGPLATRQSIGT